jgi:hypothetical protein
MVDLALPPNIAFEPPGWPHLRRAAGGGGESAPAARSDCRRAAAQRGRWAVDRRRVDDLEIATCRSKGFED